MYVRGKKLSKPKAHTQKNPKNHFIYLKKEIEIKDRITRDIRTLFETEEKDYYKPKAVSNFWNNYYIQHESNGEKNRNLTLNGYFSETEPYLRNIIIDLRNSNTWNIQLTIAVNFISWKDAEEQRLMY